MFLRNFVVKLVKKTLQWGWGGVLHTTLALVWCEAAFALFCTLVGAPSREGRRSFFGKGPKKIPAAQRAAGTPKNPVITGF